MKISRNVDDLIDHIATIMEEHAKQTEPKFNDVENLKSIIKNIFYSAKNGDLKREKSSIENTRVIRDIQDRIQRFCKRKLQIQ